MKRIALAALLALPTIGALAESIYRCGNTYQQTPCSGATLVDAGDVRTQAQWTAAKAVAAEEHRLGRDMERERLMSEARARTAPAALTAPIAAPVERPHAAVETTKRAKVKQRRYVTRAPSSPDEFIAIGPRVKQR